jgi:hypothetical protein
MRTPPSPVLRYHPLLPLFASDFLYILTHHLYHLPRFIPVHLTCTYPIPLFDAVSTCAEIYLHDSKRKSSERRSACARWAGGEESSGADPVGAMRGGRNLIREVAHNGNTFAGKEVFGLNAMKQLLRIRDDPL